MTFQYAEDVIDHFNLSHQVLRADQMKPHTSQQAGKHRNPVLSVVVHPANQGEEYLQLTGRHDVVIREEMQNLFLRDVTEVFGAWNLHEVIAEEGVQVVAELGESVLLCDWVIQNDIVRVELAKIFLADVHDDVQAKFFGAGEELGSSVVRDFDVGGVRKVKQCHHSVHVEVAQVQRHDLSRFALQESGGQTLTVRSQDHFVSMDFFVASRHQDEIAQFALLP